MSQWRMSASWRAFRPLASCLKTKAAMCALRGASGLGDSRNCPWSIASCRIEAIVRKHTDRSVLPEFTLVWGRFGDLELSLHQEGAVIKIGCDVKALGVSGQKDWMEGCCKLQTEEVVILP